jgi:hypothetical protein
MTVSALLAQVSVPTPGMHSRDDARVPFDQGDNWPQASLGRGSCPCRARHSQNFCKRLEHFSRRSAPIRQSRAPRQTKNGRVKIDVDDPSTSFTALPR